MTQHRRDASLPSALPIIVLCSEIELGAGRMRRSENRQGRWPGGRSAGVPGTEQHSMGKPHVPCNCVNPVCPPFEHLAGIPHPAEYSTCGAKREVSVQSSATRTGLQHPKELARALSDKLFGFVPEKRGETGQASPLRIAVDPDLPAAPSPWDHLAIDRFTGGASDGKKFDALGVRLIAAIKRIQLAGRNVGPRGQRIPEHIGQSVAVVRKRSEQVFGRAQVAAVGRRRGAFQPSGSGCRTTAQTDLATTQPTKCRSQPNSFAVGKRFCAQIE